MGTIEFKILLEKSVRRPENIGIAQRVHECLISEYTLTGNIHADLQMMADLLHKTPRTLQRRLESCNTCFSTVLDKTRMWIAAGWLVYTDGLISDLFSRLGYHDRTSLSNAFVRNFSINASEFRSLAYQQDIPSNDTLHAVLIAGEKSLSFDVTEMASQHSGVLVFPLRNARIN